MQRLHEFVSLMPKSTGRASRMLGAVLWFYLCSADCAFLLSTTVAITTLLLACVYLHEISESFTFSTITWLLLPQRSVPCVITSVKLAPRLFLSIRFHVPRQGMSRYSIAYVPSCAVSLTSQVVFVSLWYPSPSQTPSNHWSLALSVGFTSMSLLAFVG